MGDDFGFGSEPEVVRGPKGGKKDKTKQAADPQKESSSTLRVKVFQPRGPSVVPLPGEDPGGWSDVNKPPTPPEQEAEAEAEAPAVARPAPSGVSVAKIAAVGVLSVGVLAGLAGAFYFLVLPRLIRPSDGQAKPYHDPAGIFSFYYPADWLANPVEGGVTASDANAQATLTMVARAKGGKTLTETAQGTVDEFERTKAAWRQLVPQAFREIAGFKACHLRYEWCGGKTIRYGERLIAQTDRHDVSLTVGCAKDHLPRYRKCFGEIINSLQLHAAPAPAGPASQAKAPPDPKGSPQAGPKDKAQPQAKAGTQQPAGKAATGEPRATVRDPAKPRFGFIPRANPPALWPAVKRGAEAAAKELGVEVRWRGLEGEAAVVQQAEIVDAMVAEKVSGIALAPQSAPALAEALKKALAAKVPVVIIEWGTSLDGCVAVVATDQGKAGQMGAERLAAAIGAKGKVALLRHIQGQAATEEREKGFLDALAKFPDITCCAQPYSRGDLTQALQAVASILAATPDLAGIFAVGEPGAVGALNAVKNAGLAGKVKVVGCDASPVLINALRNGSLDATIVQDPFQVGYQGIKALHEAIQGKPVPNKERRTPARLVTRENLDTPEVQEQLAAH